MRTTSMFWVAATTIMLVLVTVFAALDAAFGWIFLLTVAGQAMMVYMIYRVLTDQYSTEKTFDDFYEDSPRES